MLIRFAALGLLTLLFVPVEGLAQIRLKIACLDLKGQSLNLLPQPSEVDLQVLLVNPVSAGSSQFQNTISVGRYRENSSPLPIKVSEESHAPGFQVDNATVRTVMANADITVNVPNIVVNKDAFLILTCARVNDEVTAIIPFVAIPRNANGVIPTTNQLSVTVPKAQSECDSCGDSNCQRPRRPVRGLLRR